MVVLTLAAGLTGCANAKGQFQAYDSVSTHIRAAATALQQATGLRAVGTVRDSRGKDLAIDVRMNAAGDGLGRVTRNAAVGNVLTVDGSTYVRATASWWAPDNRAESYDRVWVRADPATLGIDFATKLRAATLGTTLQDAFGDASASTGAVTSINGIPTRKIEGDGSAFWLSASAPYRVVRLEGRLLTGLETQPVALTLTATSPSATAQTSRDVALLLPQLRSGAYDAQHALQFDGALRTTCDASGCTVTGRIRNASTDTPVTAVLNGTVSGHKVVLGRCRSARTPVAAAGATSVSCRMSTNAWKAFYVRATAPGAGMSTTTYEVSANASALGPAPESVACLPAGSGCATPTMTTAQVAATFERSATAWYRKAVTDEALPNWRALIRTATASKDRVPWSSRGTATVAYLGASMGRPFVAQFARGTGALVAAYGPDNAETAALRQAIAGRR